MSGRGSCILLARWRSISPSAEAIADTAGPFALLHFAPPTFYTFSPKMVTRHPCVTFPHPPPRPSRSFVLLSYKMARKQILLSSSVQLRSINTAPAAFIRHCISPHWSDSLVHVRDSILNMSHGHLLVAPFRMMRCIMRGDCNSSLATD